MRRRCPRKARGRRRKKISDYDFARSGGVA